MAWDSEMITILRFMIGDIPLGSATTTYDDETLQTAILVGAQLTLTEVVFNRSYRININDLTITPDPTLDITRDEGFINLSLAKTACMIDNTEARMAAKRAVLMRDAQKTIDLRQVSLSKIEIWKNGWCKNYETIKFQYETGNVTAGAAIIGPFRIEANWMAGPWSPDNYGVGYGGYFNQGGESLGGYR